ncbi:tRNA epoxyqueuosine(34) reductase QueG [Puia sp. P3]|uniref:tRNA epoxyqueuosine(34) reductase QueG n=1 Tax=Puia sp. P3 TaxID=3423952 RepID=UPI003D6713F5
MSNNNHTYLIKAWSRELGFDYCGIARAQRLDDDARRLETWLNKGMNGTMAYMGNHFDMRIDPSRLVPGARSVITLMLNYFPAEEQPVDAPKFSKYAYGEDYHEVIRAKLRELLGRIRANIGEVEGRGFVDSAPVLERSWAVRSGLGWVGKNGNLLTKQSGSFFFLATLIVDLELEYDAPFAGDYCGTCRRCIDACPTEAILPNKVVDGSKCISYFTIELKDLLIPDEMKGKFDNWAFGCDTCQDVCPLEPIFQADAGALLYAGGGDPGLQCGGLGAADGREVSGDLPQFAGKTREVCRPAQEPPFYFFPGITTSLIPP